MLKETYDFTLYTPLGQRNGLLELTILDYKENSSNHNLDNSFLKFNLYGSLSIFQNKELVTGQIYKDGSCYLKGMIVTLSNKFPFIAFGKFNYEEIKLAFYIKHDRHTHKLKGTAVIANKNGGETYELY